MWCRWDSHIYLCTLRISVWQQKCTISYFFHPVLRCSAPDHHNAISIPEEEKQHPEPKLLSTDDQLSHNFVRDKILSSRLVTAKQVWKNAKQGFSENYIMMRWIYLFANCSVTLAKYKQARKSGDSEFFPYFSLYCQQSIQALAFAFEFVLCWEKIWWLSRRYCIWVKVNSFSKERKPHFLKKKCGLKLLSELEWWITNF